MIKLADEEMHNADAFGDYADHSPICQIASHKEFMRDALSDDAAATPRSALPGRGARALTSSQPAPSGASGPPTTLLIITACAAISWCCSLHLRLQPD